MFPNVKDEMLDENTANKSKSAQLTALNVRVSRAEQSENAQPPMKVTASGMVIEVNDEQ